MNKAVLFLLGLATVTLTGCPSGYRFERVPGEPPIVDKRFAKYISDLGLAVRDSCPGHALPVIHSTIDTLTVYASSDPFGAPGARAPLDPDVLSAMHPILSFVHLSDAQLKEERISLDGPLGEGIYDDLSGAAARDPDLEENDYAVFLATILGINALVTGEPAGYDTVYAPAPNPLPPQFVIHTGDAIDAGMFSETFEFLTIVNELIIPFYNLIGNHDALFFGTFPKEAMQGIDITLPFVPVNSVDQFMVSHSFERNYVDIKVPFLLQDKHYPTVLGEPRNKAGSTIVIPDSVEYVRIPLPRGVNYHGFDLICPRRSDRDPSGNNALCNEADGYYSFDARVYRAWNRDSLDVRFIMLNTSEVLPGSKAEAIAQASRGAMRWAQYEWLQREVVRPGTNTGEPPVIFVAGHHNLDGFIGAQEDSLKHLLQRHPRVVAYLSGHTHVNEFISHVSDAGDIVEVIGGSTLVYPQYGLLTELLETEEAPETFYLRVRSFRQGLSTEPCSSHPSCQELALRAKSGREGARRDVNDHSWREETQAIPQANGLLRLSWKP